MLDILKREYVKYKKPVVAKIKEEKNDPYRILIATIISLRTKDAITEIVSENLFKIADNPFDMIKVPHKTIEKIIYPCGFYRNKAKAILLVSKELIEKYNAKVPDTIEELLSLPMVGRKTANLVLSVGYGRAAICVDTHVHRISNRFGIVKTKNPMETEFCLMKILPKKWWIIYNDMLVVWGQNVCKPIKPLCFKCVLNEYCERIGVKT